MRYVFAAFMLLMFCALSAFLAEAAPEGALKSSENEILTRLPNGLLVYIIRDKRFPVVCTRLYVRAGSGTEDPAQAGISHVLEHMVFKGTSHRPKGQVARDIEALGGYLNAATSFDKTWYITDMPAQHWRTGMEVVKEMAFQATLDPAELEAEKNVVISELQRGEDSPGRKLFENMQVAALKNTPYGRPIIGFEESIRRLTAKDLADYVAKWYQPQNMMLLVAGDLNPDEILDYAQTLFGKLENHSDLAVVEPLDIATAALGSGQVEVTRGTWHKVYLGIALPVPGLQDLRSVDLDVLAYVLGGDATSTFYKKYKYEKQIVDSISVGNMSMARAGMFVITATLDAEKVGEFWDELTEDLGRLTASSFDDAAIARAKFNLEDSMDRAGETLNGLVSWRGTLQFELGGRQGEENLRFAQRNVDKSQLQEAIENWLDSRQARVRVIAPEQADLPDFGSILARNWPAAAETEKKQAAGGKGTVEIVALDGGCQLILLPDDNAPYISLDLLMPGGNALLTPEQQGLADLTARLLTAGSGEMSSPAMERWLAERAMSLSVQAGLQTFGISMDGPSRFNQELFPMFRNVLFKPRFEAGELTREINNMKAALRQRDDQPLAYMFSKVNPFIFPGEPYGYDKLGTIASLDTLNTVKVRDFWAKQGGQPWALAVAGNFDRDAVLKFASTLAQPHAEKFELKPPVWGAWKKLALNMPGRNQAHLMRLFRTVSATHPDAPALLLLEAAISGQSGVLFSQLRDEEGLGYTVTAFNHAMPEAGYLAFYIGTTPDKMAQASTGFDQIIAQLKKEPLPAETLKTAANRLHGEYVRGRQSLASRAGEAATDAVLGRQQDFQKELIDKAAALKPEDILAVAQKYLVEPYEVTLLP